VNHILANQHGLKVAVIVNEIGDIGIDSELIIGTGEDMMELSNGCICCSLNNDLVDAIFRVLHRDKTFDYLVVESTGLADPLPIVLTFMRSEFRDLVRVDSVITIADADNFAIELFESEAAHNQLRYADIILLNKCDLASTQRLCAIEEGIRSISRGTRIVHTTCCQVPLPLILSVGLFQSDRYFADGSDHVGRDHLANDGFEALSFQADRPFAADRFQYFLLSSSRTTSFVPRACCGSMRATGATFSTWSARDLHWTRAGRLPGEQPAGADRPEPGPEGAARAAGGMSLR
jgi:G3E family GTPase